MTLRVSDWQSESDLDGIPNSYDVFYVIWGMAKLCPKLSKAPEVAHCIVFISIGQWPRFLNLNHLSDLYSEKGKVLKSKYILTSKRSL